MFRLPLLSALLVLPVTAQGPAPSRAEVPTFPNPTCPIMGKKVSMPLFIDTELGRFYVCCKPCYKKVLADVPAAHKTAYPVVQDVANATCPVSGEPIGADAVPVVLQGYRFRVCCDGCVAAARQHSQVTLTRVTRPGSVDVGNRTCPLTGAEVAPNAFVVIDDAIVHLAAAKLLEEAGKDPAAVLAKAKRIAAAQPPAPKHVHTRPGPKTGDAGQEPGK